MKVYQSSYSQKTPNLYHHQNLQKLSLIDFNKTLHIINAEIRKQFNETRKKKIYNQTSRKNSVSNPIHNRASSLDLLYFENQSVSHFLKQNFFQSFNKKYHQMQNQFKASFPIKKILRNKKKQRINQMLNKQNKTFKSCFIKNQTVQVFTQTTKSHSNFKKIKFQQQKQLNFEKFRKFNRKSSQTYLQRQVNSKMKQNKMTVTQKYCDSDNNDNHFLETIAKKKPLNTRKINTDYVEQKYRFPKQKKLFA